MVQPKRINRANSELPNWDTVGILYSCRDSDGRAVVANAEATRNRR